MKPTLLITRPAHQAVSLCKQIQNWGGVPLIFPTIEIAEPKNNSSFILGLQRLAEFDIAIFTSANAVNKTVPHWPNLSSSPKILAIGPGTAQALEQEKITVDQTPAENFGSEALLKLPVLQNPNGKKIIIFTGEEGRLLLQETLSQRGAEVFMAYAYRRRLPNLDPATLAEWKKKHFDLIICTSNQSLQNLLTLFGTADSNLKKTTLLVISERMHSFAKEQGFADVIVSAEASDKAILDALKLWYSKLRTNNG